ncbi:TPA: hypothetical protein QHK97_002865 [Enterobacter kobei]|nr:hypothetical protein [Enterobacter kobei]
MYIQLFFEVIMPRTADIPNAFFTVSESFLPASAKIVETQEGFDVIDKALSFNRGDTLLIWFYGRQQHAYWAGSALITDDGEAIEGEALDDVRLVGVVTHTISPVWVDDNPVM